MQVDGGDCIVFVCLCLLLDWPDKELVWLHILFFPLVVVAILLELTNELIGRKSHLSDANRTSLTCRINSAVQRPAQTSSDLEPRLIWMRTWVRAKLRPLGHLDATLSLAGSEMMNAIACACEA